MLAKPCAGDALALTLKNDLAEIAPVALLVAELGARHAVPEATVSHFNLALDEAIDRSGRATMQLTTVTVGAVAVLAAAGRIDSATAKALEDKLLGLIKERPPALV